MQKTIFIVSHIFYRVTNFIRQFWSYLYGKSVSYLQRCAIEIRESVLNEDMSVFEQSIDHRRVVIRGHGTRFKGQNYHNLENQDEDFFGLHR